MLLNRSALLISIMVLVISACTSMPKPQNVELRSPTSFPDSRYYKGTETNYKPDGKTINYTVQYYCKRTLDPENGRLSEHTLLVFSNGKSAEFNTEMSISSDGSTFSVVDTTGMVSGGGKFVGTPWAWSGMTGVFTRKNGMRTEDINVLTDEIITGFKKDYSAPSPTYPTGELTDLDIGVLSRTTEAEFNNAISEARLKK